jgi:GNAT superfamily N-acetyltransferase
MRTSIVERGQYDDTLIRNYRPEDYPFVREILIEADMVDEDRHTEEKLRNRSNDLIQIAMINDEVVGTFFLEFDGIYPFAFGLVVKKQYRGKKIGELLINKAKIIAERHGHNHFEIMVNEEKSKLKRWYQKLGFSQGEKYRSMWIRTTK